MKVLFFHAYPHQYAGAQRVTHELCHHLVARGHAATVCTVDEGPFPAALRRTGVDVEIVRAPAPWRMYGRALEGRRAALAGLSTLPWYWARLTAAIHRRQPDVVHMNDHRGAMLSVVPAKAAGAAVVWHLHGTYDSRAITELGGRLSDAILVVSEDTRARQAHLGPYAAKTSVLHNGLLTLPERFGSAQPSEPRIVLTGARTHPDKGLDVFIRAAAVVHEAAPDGRFDIAGPVQKGYEDYHRELEELRDSLGLSDVLRFAGVVDDPQAVWSRASVYVQSSRKEPFGMGVLEAMALGVPVVTTKVGGMQEIVEPGRSGLQVPAEDHAALADAVLRCLDDEDLRATLVGGAQERVRDAFTVDAMLDRLLAVYGEVTRAH